MTDGGGGRAVRGSSSGGGGVEFTHEGKVGDSRGLEGDRKIKNLF